MRSWRFKVKFKPMHGGNDNKTDTDRKAVIQAMTHIRLIYECMLKNIILEITAGKKARNIDFRDEDTQRTRS